MPPGQGRGLLNWGFWLVSLEQVARQSSVCRRLQGAPRAWRGNQKEEGRTMEFEDQDARACTRRHRRTVLEQPTIE